ncbi:MAG: BNR-4 repeat-containing protein [Clostridia bacterium]|nr:BNR-4 repeat-containing protein [Clostridia bacterium]
MKMKRFSALLVALIMVISMLPAIGTSAAETTTVLNALSGEVVWSAPDKGNLYDAAVSANWDGWSSTGSFANLRTYDNYDVLQFYSAHQVNLEATVTASDAVKNATKGADMVVIEWKHKWQSDAADCYYNFTFRDADGNDITTFTLDKNVTDVSDTHKFGFSAANYVDMALVYYNNSDGDTHSVEYYVAGEKVYTDSSLAGVVDGFGSIAGSDGWWTNYAHIGFANLTVGTVINSETTVEVTATYTLNGETVKTETKRYDSSEADGVTFPAFGYAANGENVLYTAEEATLSESAEIELTAVPNTGEYGAGDIVAHDGKQYSVKTDNLIPNADFSYGLAGWYNGLDSAVDTNNFKAEGNALIITSNGGTNSAAGISRAWDVEVGKTYFLTFTLDQAIEWARVAETSDASAYTTASKTLIDKSSSVKGKNNLVFTATDEFVRASFAWAAERKLSAFGLYEIEEAEEVVTESIKAVEALEPVVALEGDTIVLPETAKVEGTLGSITEGSIRWNEPDSYNTNETVTVTGTVSVKFSDSATTLRESISVDVTVYGYDHTVETFWHAGDDSNSANFGLYNYINNYNGGTIIADTHFNTASGTNKLIMYGNASTGNFSGAGALLRYMNTQVNGEYVFEYHDGDWKTSSVICDYNAEYVLRTTIDITNKKYTLAISANGGEFVNVTPAPAAFRNGGLNSIDRMISTGSVTITEHKTAWIDGFSYLNVEYVDENGTALRDGYRVKAATGVQYIDSSAPKMIESGDKLYLLEDVNTSPSIVVAEGEDTLTVTYHEVEMVEFESPTVNHVRGDAAINLPSQVKMVFSDNQKILYPVTWDTTSVDTEALGEYEAIGTIDGIEMKATATVKVRDVEILPKTTTNTVATNNGGWNWYVEPSGTHIQPGDSLATRYESGQYSSNNGYVFKHDKTYMGWVEDEGTIVVGEYDHDNDTYKRVVVHEFLEADDHNNPAVVVLPDGRIMIFYSKHTTENRMYYCVSKNPEDISEWNDWQYYYCYTAVENTTYNATYPSVFMVHDDEGVIGNDVIYVGWRGVHWKPTLAKFSMPDENGVIETIMGQTQFANTTYKTGSYADGGRSDSGRRPYTKYDYDFDRNLIYITFTANHPDNDVNNNIYYVTFNIEDQGIYTAKGNFLQTLPFENRGEYASQGAAGSNGQWGVITNDLVDDYPELLLFDANEQITSGGERRGWTWDIKVNEKGEPCIVYVDVTATAPGPNGELPTWYGPNVNDSHRSHHYYWYARWDSDTETWVKTFLTYGGKWWHENATQERCYSGGLTFDHNATDANVIYLSIPTMGEHGNIFEIYRWESDDHGATWTVREPITENSKINNVRPNAIYNYKVDEDGNHAGPRLLWKSGEYRYWMNYEYKTGVWTDFAADGFITQDDPEMFADAALYADGEKLEKLPVGDATVTGKFNITNISIGDGSVYLALAHYNKDGALVKVTTLDAVIPARSVAQIGMVGAPKTADGGLSPMGTAEIVEEIEYSATFNEGDMVKLFAWNQGIEHPMSDITSVVFEMSTEGNKFDFVETFTYEGTEKLILDENGENFNGWVGKAYGNNAAFGTHSYAAITKAPFGNTGLHLYHVGSGGESGSGAVMASHALPDSEGKDYQIKFSMRYIDEMSWNNTTNAGFTLSHGVPVYNDGNATPCAIQFRHSSGWKHYNGRGTEGWLRRTRWFDGGGQDWIFGNGIYSEYGRGNEYDALMTGSNYEVTIDVSPANKTISFSIFDGHRTVYHTESYVDATSYDWDNNPIDTLTFSVGDDKWGEMYVDDVTVEIME